MGSVCHAPSRPAVTGRDKFVSPRSLCDEGDDMRVSVIICSLDRVARVRRCLAALVAQTAASEVYEVIVVDNGSRDGTCEMVRAEFGSHPNVSVISEPERGLARARNTGWRAATGDIVSYVDDDAIPAPDFVAQVIRVFTTVTPRPGIVGGRIDPLWEAPRPPWLTRALAAYLTIVDWGPNAGPLVPGQQPVGCNMSAPRALIAAVGGFDVSLGRVGSRLLSMEDSALGDAIRATGHSGYYDPAIVVQHCIPPERLTRAWMRRRVYWEGASLALHKGRSGSSLARAAAALALKEPGAWLALARDSDDPAAFELACLKIYRIGYLAGLLGLAR